MKRFSLFLFSLLIGIGLFIWISKIVGWQEIKNAFLVFTGWQGLVIFFLTLLITLNVTWKWKEILKGMGSDISFFDLFKYYLAGNFLSFFFPLIFWGGETSRAYLLKRKNSISWTKGMTSVIIDRIFDWTTNLIVIFFGIIFFILTIGLPSNKLAIILGGSFIVWLVGISFFYFKVFKRESLIKFFLKFFNYKSPNNEPLEIEKDLFDFFKLKKISPWKGFGLAFLEEVLYFLRTWFLISFLGKNISFFPALSILSFYYLATMIPIPTSLGIHDVVQAFAFNALRLGANFGTAFTLITRGAEAIVALIGMGILFRLGVKLFEENLFQDEN